MPPTDPSVHMKVIEECKAALPRASGEEKGIIYERMGDAYTGLGKGNKALVCYQEAFDAGNLATGFTEKYSTQLANSGKGKEAEALVRKALGRTTAPLDKARLHNQVSFIARHTGQFDIGIKAGKTALDIASSLDQGSPEVVRVLAQANTMIGLNLWRQGNIKEAKVFFDIALPLFDELGDGDGMAATLNHIGVMVSLEGEVELSLEYYQRSLEHADLARTHNNIGLSLKMLGRFDDAEKAFRETIKMARKEGHQVGIHISQLNLANLSMDRGDIVKARTWVDMAHKGFTDMGEDSMMALVLEVEARVALKEGDLKAAKMLAARALDQAQRMKEREFESNALVVFGLIAKEEGDLERAREFIQQGIRLMEKHNLQRYLGECYIDLALVHRDLGQEKEEKRAAAEAMRYLEKQGARYHLRRMEELGL